MTAELMVRDLKVETLVDGTTVLFADGHRIYQGNDDAIIKAWMRVHNEGWSFYDILLRATKEGPLLQCIHCKNTESPAGAMARQFNHGRCMHCGDYFKVVRA